MIGFGAFISNVAQFLTFSCVHLFGKKRENCKQHAHPGDMVHLVHAPLARGALLLLVVAAVMYGLTGCAKKEEMVAVPDVSKQDSDQAQKTLAANKLKPGSISGPSSAGAIVVSQSPAAGQQVAANSKVDLIVDVPVTVPPLTGSDVPDAVSKLQDLGLKVAFVKKSTINPFGKPKVEQQDPTANSSTHRGAIVTLTVSMPPDIGALLGLVAKDSAYQNLKPEYKKVLDAFLANPSTPRSMDSASTPDSPSTPTK